MFPDMAELLRVTQHALLHRIATAQVDGRAPSLVGAVVRDGAPVWMGGWGAIGDSPDDTQYRIGSISKTFVAVQVMRLRDEGRLDLADPLDKYLPGTPALSDALGADPLRHPAGRRFHYSNPGFGVLGALVAQLRGVPWGDALQQDILEPLGMTRTTLMPQQPHASGWAVHPWADVLLPEPAEDAGPMAPAGQLWSTVIDLCRFVRFLAEGDPAVLRVETLEEMRAPASGSTDRTQGYGLGMQLLYDGDRTLVGHTGSMPGFLAAVWLSVDERLGGITLTNTTAGIQIGSLAAELIDIVALHEPPLPPPWQPLQSFDDELLALTGTWYWGPTGYNLYLLADRLLRLDPLGGSGRASRFRPEPDGAWTGLEGYYAGERLRIGRDAGGRVTHVDIGTFVFTRTPYDPAAPVPGGVDPDGWRGLS